MTTVFDSPLDLAMVGQVRAIVGRRVTELGEQYERDHGQPWSDDDERQVALDEIGREIQTLIATQIRGNGRPPMQQAEIAALRTAVFNRIFGLAAIEDLISNPEFTDIFINGCDCVHVLCRNGEAKSMPPVAESDEELVTLVANMAQRAGRAWDRARPTLDLQLETGHRLHAIAFLGDRPAVTIRLHDFSINRLSRLLELGTISQSLLAFLMALVLARRNVIIAGSTGSGKTTLTRCLINEIPPDRRKITIEDSAELQIKRWPELHPNAVTLEAREANLEGAGRITMQRLVREALRMKPDHLIVGEFRGEEVREALMAMNNGNEGSISTVHADSAAGVIPRIQMYMAGTPERYTPETTNLIIAGAVHFIIHVAVENGERVVTSVLEVADARGLEVGLREVYAPDATGRAVPAAGLSEQMRPRFQTAGFDLAWLTPEHGRWER